MFNKVPNFLQFNLERNLAILLGVVILSLGLVFITLAWTEPSQGPPGGNVSAPINVSGTDQAKSGRLGVGTAGGTDNRFDVSIGGDGVHDGLKVSGVLNMDGGDITDVNKITVNTIDPVFKIGDKKYATYFPDMIGQKTEVTGEAELEGGEKVIDLAQQEQGSDLWLFWQAVAHDTVVPFVSAQGPASLYVEREGSKVVVRKFAGEENVPFSYRLIGTRLDHVDSDNLYSDQETDTYIDINQLRD